MFWILVLLAVVGVVVIALVFVGAATRLLSELPSQAVFDMEEAVDFIAAKLPFEVAAVLTHDDVRSVVTWQLEYFDDKDVPVQDSDAVDLVLGEVITDEDEALDAVLSAAADAEMELDPLHAVVVQDRLEAYLVAIGAIGAPVADEFGPTGGFEPSV